MESSTGKSDHQNQDSIANENNDWIGGLGNAEERKNIAKCLSKVGICIDVADNKIFCIAKMGADEGATVRNQNSLDELSCNSQAHYFSSFIVDIPAPKDDGGEMLLSVFECIKVETVYIGSETCDVSSWISLIAGKWPCLNIQIECAIIGTVGCDILLDQLRSGNLDHLKIGGYVELVERGARGQRGAPYWNIRRQGTGCWEVDMCRYNHTSEVPGIYVLTTFVQDETTKIGCVKSFPCIFGNENVHVLGKCKEFNLKAAPINAGVMGMLVSSIQNKQNLTALKIYSMSDGLHEVEEGEIEPAGCEVIASFLQGPSCNLRTLELSHFPTNDECAAILARGIRGNTTLEDFFWSSLNHYANTITRRGYDAFSKALCDTTSVGDIYFSNHMIKSIGIGTRGTPNIKLNRLLLFNNSPTDRKEIALKKILRYKGRLDVSSLFELELKLLPTLVHWFDGTSVALNSYKIDAIYQFIQANAELS